MKYFSIKKKIINEGELFLPFHLIVLRMKISIDSVDFDCKLRYFSNELEDSIHQNLHLFEL